MKFEVPSNIVEFAISLVLLPLHFLTSQQGKQFGKKQV